MRKSFYYTLAFLLLINLGYAQNNITEQGIYKIPINIKEKVYLASLTDSSLQVLKFKYGFIKFANKGYNYYDAKRFPVISEGNIVHGFLWGSGLGMTFSMADRIIMNKQSTLAGSIDPLYGYPQPVSFKELTPGGAGAIFGALVGGIAGLYVGSLKQAYNKR